ncbi:MAG: LuxR family transcriptional regulator [Acidobacteria bacterium]|nr:MAG: LuxR family transcriptional regulator [Acidobacteriota bacterium]
MDSTSSGRAFLIDFSNSLAEHVELAMRAIVAVNARVRLPSTGVHWSRGVVVTAAHTIKRNEDITATLPDGRTTPATLAGLDLSTDLAALRIDAPELPVAELDDGSSLKLGQLMLAVSHGGDIGHYTSLGIVGGLGGPWRTWRGAHIERFIRPNLAIYPGFSGSALINAQGLVVGINTAGLSRRMPLTIPTSTVRRVVEELLRKGRIVRGFLGVGLQPVRLPASLKRKLNLASQNGVILLSLEPDGPADKSGLLIGDVLLELDGKTMADVSDVQDILAPEYVGKTVRARLIRAGDLVELSLTIAERSGK